MMKKKVKNKNESIVTLYRMYMDVLPFCRKKWARDYNIEKIILSCNNVIIKKNRYMLRCEWNIFHCDSDRASITLIISYFVSTARYVKIYIERGIKKINTLPIKKIQNGAKNEKLNCKTWYITIKKISSSPNSNQSFTFLYTL